MTKLSSSEPNKQYCNIRQLWAIHSEVHTCLRISWKFIHCTGVVCGFRNPWNPLFWGLSWLLPALLGNVLIFFATLHCLHLCIYVTLTAWISIEIWAITKLDLSFFSLVQLMVQHIFSDIRTYLSREAVQTKPNQGWNSGLNRNAVEWENQALFSLQRDSHLVLTSFSLNADIQISAKKGWINIPRGAAQTKPNQGWFLILVKKSENQALFRLQRGIHLVSAWSSLCSARI